VTQSEQLITQKQTQIDDITRLLNDFKRDLEKKEEEIKAVKLENENQRLILKESKEQIEQNNNVISYLNQKLNENSSISKNFNNILNFNAANLNTGLNSGVGMNYNSSVKTSFPDSNKLVEKYELNSNAFNEIQSKNQVLSNLNNNYKV
jgi:hypothetical protein